jgi:Arc/MetJ-type ribon-helix-helix transcriptional regulator
MIMKYIITESQYQLLMESTIFDRIKRRFNRQYLIEFIEEAIEDEDAYEPCSEFSDGYEYADEVIRKAINNFLYSLGSEIELTDESLEETEEILVDLSKDWFEDSLMEGFEENCSDDKEYKIEDLFS